MADYEKTNRNEMERQVSSEPLRTYQFITCEGYIVTICAHSQNEAAKILREMNK